MSTTRIGKEAEDAAVAYIEKIGYHVIARNLRTPEGEIDIVAREGTTVVFLEVKSRGSRRFGSALAAVDHRKRRRIRESAANFMQFFPQGEKTMTRFDVLTFERGVVALMRDAF